MKQLTVRSLSNLSATGFQAWLIFLPLVLIDGFILEFILAPEPLIPQAFSLMGLAGVTYLLAGVWYLLAYQCKRSQIGRKYATPLTLLAFLLAGVTWSWTLVTLGIWSGSETINAWQVQPSLLAVGIGGAQVVIGSFAAIVLYARDQARSATHQLVKEREQFQVSQSNMVAIRIGVQFQFRSWINHVLKPALDRVRGELASHSSAAASNIDEVREHIVRSTSQRLHPRMVEMGPFVALAAIMRAHGITPLNISVSERIEVNSTEIAVLARCLDVVLTQSEDQQTRVQLEPDPRGVRFIISSRIDSVTAAGPEIEARVQQLGGSVFPSNAGDLIIFLPRAITQSESEPRVVSSDDLSVPALVALGLVLPTAVVIGLLGGTWTTAILGSFMAMSAGFFARIFPVSELIAGNTRRHRIMGVAGIIGVGVVTSGLVTLVWGLVQPNMSGSIAQWAFGVTNAIVISFVVAVLVVARSFIRAWELQVSELEEIAAQSGRSACAAILHVDRLRERVASILHSHVQARLVVAAAEAEDGDFFGAENAIEAIVNQDVPLLLAELEIPSPSAQSLDNFVRGLVGVDVDIVIDPPESVVNSAELMEVAFEAMVNSVRHGRATRIDIHLQQVDATWEVRIHDNGVGVHHMNTRGLGLTLVDVATGGNWNLDSGPQGGAQLFAVVSA